MAVALTEWLELIDKEYLRDFIVQGGAAVKFVIADETGEAKLAAAFAGQAAAHGMVFARLDSAEVKLHMMQDVFFAVSRQMDWEADAQRFVEAMFRRHEYRWPAPGQPIALNEIADANHVDPTILRRELNTWLSSDLMSDPGMAQDFRIALMQLCQNRLVPADHEGDTVAPILQWLRGELRVLSPLKSAFLYSKITRHSARAMLRSLCRWLRLAGHNGLFLTIDIRQVTRLPAVGARHVKNPGTEAASRIEPAPSAVRYTAGAVMDAYEVLRQLVDDADLFDGFFLAVVADHAFIGPDVQRSVDAYTALKMRIWDDVRAREDNPLAPMVVVNAEC
jgi:hypothetical protein